MDNLVLFYPTGHSGHFEPGHPERPERVEAIRTALEAADAWEKYPKLKPIEVSRTILESVHSPAYLSLLQRACSAGPGRLDMDTYITKLSWQLALNAASGAAAVVQAVWQKTARRSLALCRPPGHHAMRGQGMGFCLINNIAVAAELLLKQEGARRVAIVDLDLHHGNGTQAVFWDRQDVMFLSTHQSPLYPGTGSLRERGIGAGLGYTLNFPMPPRSGDEAFITVMDKLLLPVLERYSPEIILVSYGFDTHWSDPIGSLLLSASGYAQLIARLTKFADQHCDGRIALVLEGGYDIEAGQACTLAILDALLGKPWEDKLGPSPYYESDTWKTELKTALELWDL
jgi:acetoin utilization deacetylase AcuC-like enzyme